MFFSTSLKDGNITLQRNLDENIKYLGVVPELDENGEKINSTSKVTWSKTEPYEWKKGDVGEKNFFKIKDPVSKKILTVITNEEFELQGKF